MTHTARLFFLSYVNKRLLLFPGLMIGCGLLVLAFFWSITLGAANIDRQTVVDAIIHHDDTQFNHLVIRLVRLPRVLSGLIVGAALAVAGAIMQGLTRNPLADPGLLGISSGAAFAVVATVHFRAAIPLSSYTLLAFMGGAIAAAIVYGLASAGHGGLTPLKLTLAGVILTAFVSSLTTAILITDVRTLDQVRFWLAGSLAGREMPLLERTAPYMIIGLGFSMLLARQMTTMSLGEDVAKGLGQDTERLRIYAALTVVLLAGGAVALAGPIGFVGLIVPHIVRMVVGADYRWIIPYSIVFGALLVTVADVFARIIIRPQELPVGIMLALLGAPFFIYLARRRI